MPWWISREHGRIITIAFSPGASLRLGTISWTETTPGSEAEDMVGLGLHFP